MWNKLCSYIFSVTQIISIIFQIFRIFRNFRTLLWHACSLVSSGPLLSLDWVPSFRPKHDTSLFRPASPSIHFLSTDMAMDLSLCPVRALRTFLSVSSSWVSCSTPDIRQQFLWYLPGCHSHLSVSSLSTLFIRTVRSALSFAGLPTRSNIGPHQMRKLAASLSVGSGQDEVTVMRNMGFSSLKILRKNYVAAAPPLRFACSLHGGPFSPQVSFLIWYGPIFISSNNKKKMIWSKIQN